MARILLLVNYAVQYYLSSFIPSGFQFFFLSFFVEYRVHGINKQLELLIERTAAKEIGQNVDAAKPES